LSGYCRPCHAELSIRRGSCLCKSSYSYEWRMIPNEKS
jgi:hypothetical protein